MLHSVGCVLSPSLRMTSAGTRNSETVIGSLIEFLKQITSVERLISLVWRNSKSWQHRAVGFFEKLKVKFNWHETPKLFRKWIMQMGQPTSTHRKSVHWRVSWGLLKGKKLKRKSGVSSLPVQGRSEVRDFYMEMSRHMWRGFHTVGNHVNRTLGGAHKWGSAFSLMGII